MLKLTLSFLLALGTCTPNTYNAHPGEKYVVVLRDGLPHHEIQAHHARIHDQLESLDTLSKRQLKQSDARGFNDSKSTIGDVHFHAYEVKMTPELASRVARDPAVALVERDAPDPKAPGQNAELDELIKSVFGEHPCSLDEASEACKASKVSPPSNKEYQVQAKRSTKDDELDALISSVFSQNTAESEPDGASPKIAPEPTVSIDAKNPTAVSSLFSSIPMTPQDPLYEDYNSVPDSLPLMTAEDAKQLRERMDNIIKGKKLNVQHNAPWSLARLSHRRPANYSEDSQNYLYHATGKGNLAYVLDTYVQITHQEFEGRVRWGADFRHDNDTGEVNLELLKQRGLHWHGTHVTGILAGKTVGIAKSAEVVVVSLSQGRSDEDAYVARFLRSIHWIIDDYVKNGNGRRAVINHSLKAYSREAYKLGIKYAIGAGILFVSGAGNDGAFACDYAAGGLAQYVGKITVGSVKPDLTTRGAMTNFGNCIDVSYHGDNTYSARPQTDSSYAIDSGTSFATPYISGLALYLWELDPTLTLREISELLINNNPGVMQGDLDGTPNKFAYNGADGFAFPA